MALTSVFYDGPVTETDRAKNRAGAPDYGVYGGDDFKVRQHPTLPYALFVGKGKAHGHGVTDTAETDQVVQCDTLSGAGTVRWDLIVVRRNWQPLLGGPSKLVAIPGGVNTTIPAARLNNPGVEDDQPIAMVQWNGGLNTPKQIIDLRCWAANGGMEIANEIAFEYLSKPGSAIRFEGLTWRYTLQANSVWAWSAEGFAQNYGAVSPTGYKTTGNTTLESVSDKMRLTVDLTIQRTGGDLLVSQSAFSGFGQVLATAVLGDSPVKYVPISVSGGGNNNTATLAVDPATGVFSIRGVGGTLTLKKGSLFTVNLSYFI